MSEFKKLGEGVYIKESEIGYEHIRMWLKKLHPHFESQPSGEGMRFILCKGASDEVTVVMQWKVFKMLNEQDERTKEQVEAILQKLLA